MNGLSDEADKYGGNELLAYLRDNYPNIPIIIVTSITDPTIKLKSLFMGASYFMKKPEVRTQEKDMVIVKGLPP